VIFLAIGLKPAIFAARTRQKRHIQELVSLVGREGGRTTAPDMILKASGPESPAKQYI